MRIKVTEEGLSRGGVDVEIGETIEVDNVSGAFHVKRGMAVEVDDEGKEIKSKEKPQKVAGASVAPGSTNAPLGGQSSQDDELAKLTKAIDGVLNKEPLIEEAQALGIQFAFDATKPVIIQAAIDQAMGPQLLEAAKARATADADK